MAKEVPFEAIMAQNDRELETRGKMAQTVMEAKAALDDAWVEYRKVMEKELFDALLHEPKTFGVERGMDENVLQFWHPSWMKPYVEWLKAKLEFANSQLER